MAEILDSASGKLFRRGDEVHLWRIPIGGEEWPAEDLLLLDPGERARAARFVFARHRAPWIRARAALRRILARYVDATPETLPFQVGEWGKPSLCGSNGESLRFNLSHSGGLALLAVAWGREVGVDVERIRPTVELLDLATRFFSPSEVAALRAVDDARRERAFFACWSRKEALIKADGRGLSFGLDTFEVSLHPDHPAELLSVRGVPGGDRWMLREIPVDEGYAAALVVEGTGWHLVRREEQWR